MSETVAAKDAFRALLVDYANEHLPDDLPGRFIKQMVANMGGTAETVVARPSVANPPPVLIAPPPRASQEVTLPRIEANGTIKSSNYRALPKPTDGEPRNKRGRTAAEQAIMTQKSVEARRANKANRLAAEIGQLRGLEPDSPIVLEIVAKMMGQSAADDAVKNCMNSFAG